MNKKIFLALAVFCFTIGVFTFTNGIVDKSLRNIGLGLLDFVCSAFDWYMYKNY